MPKRTQNPEFLDAVISGATPAKLLLSMNPDDMDPRAKQARQAVRKNSVINAILPENSLKLVTHDPSKLEDRRASDDGAMAVGGAKAFASSGQHAAAAATSVIASSGDDDDDDDDDDAGGGAGGGTGHGDGDGDAFVKHATAATHPAAAAARKKVPGFGGPLHNAPRGGRTATSGMLDFIDASQNGALRPNQLSKFFQYLAGSEKNTLQQYLCVLCLSRTASQDTLALLGQQKEPRNIFLHVQKWLLKDMAIKHSAAIVLMLRVLEAIPITFDFLENKVDMELAKGIKAIKSETSNVFEKNAAKGVWSKWKKIKNAAQREQAKLEAKVEAAAKEKLEAQAKAAAAAAAAKERKRLNAKAKAAAAATVAAATAAAAKEMPPPSEAREPKRKSVIDPSPSPSPSPSPAPAKRVAADGAGAHRPRAEGVVGDGPAEHEARAQPEGEASTGPSPSPVRNASPSPPATPQTKASKQLAFDHPGEKVWSPAAKEEWACPKCTMLNSVDAIECVVCGTHYRPSATDHMTATGKEQQQWLLQHSEVAIGMKVRCTDYADTERDAEITDIDGTRFMHPRLHLRFPQDGSDSECEEWVTLDSSRLRVDIEHLRARAASGEGASGAGRQGKRRKVAATAKAKTKKSQSSKKARSSKEAEIFKVEHIVDRRNVDASIQCVVCVCVCVCGVGGGMCARAFAFAAPTAAAQRCHAAAKPSEAPLPGCPVAPWSPCCVLRCRAPSEKV